MKKSLVALTTAAGLLALTGCSSADGKSSGDGSKAVVETNAGNITKDDLYEAMKSRVGDQTVRDLVDEKVLSKKYKVTDKELKDQMDKLKEQYQDQYQAAVQQNGEAYIKNMLKIDLLRQKAATSGVKVSEADLKKAYEEKKPEIKASHILVKDEKTAKEVKAKLDKGEDFAKVAKEYSQDPGSAQQGGDLGFFGTGTMDPAFEKAAYSLKVGEVSQPVQSQFGYHIIKLTDKKKLESFKKMKPELENELKLQKVDQSKLQSAVNKVLKDADVKVKDKDLKDAVDTGDSNAK
ncbi:peptidylprolyl isomerase [Priestia koreensis]|uniref:Foldase protein PrsA n=1 Tax=Priestia koreensis TaxID=284581 RepID=A0A0M0L8Z8_9BACI|nr:peptidylprolyl isomerase [Priestia koreensis]KOO47143.1 peptidylprolyl isomerase [Priestia koreensis]